jgi:MFS family permease
MTSALHAVTSRLRNVRDAFAVNRGNRDLRRAQIAFGAGWTSEWALMVGLAIVAFRDGGAAAVGLVALLRLAPGAIASPFLSTAADRMRRERVIAAIGIVRGVSIGLMALLLALGLPVGLVYTLAIVATVAGTPFRAAHTALVPSLCTTPEQLTSANAVRGMLDSLSMLVGPLLAAVVLELGSPAMVFAVAAAAALWSGLLVLGLRYEAPPQEAPAGRGSLLAETRAGFQALAENRDLALFIGLGVSQTFTRGCLNVLTVVMAIELLDMGESGVGILSAAVGAGAVLGSVGASLLVGSGRLGAWFGVSIALWGLPLMVIGVIPAEASALAMLAVIGLGNALLDVSGFSVMTRLAPDEVLARVFGIFEALIALTIGLGSILTPVVIGAVDVHGALLLVGAVCPVLAALSWMRLRAIDGDLRQREEELSYLRAVPILQPLPVPVMDRLARSLVRVQVPAGHAVFHQGDPGDTFYVIADGEAEVVGDGERVCTLGSPGSFGEIALLRDCPRTTGVRALTDLDLFALDRGAFLLAVDGYGPASSVADSVVARLLDRFSGAGLQPLSRPAVP